MPDEDAVHGEEACSGRRHDQDIAELENITGAVHDVTRRGIAALERGLKLEMFIAAVKAELDDAGRPAEEIVDSIRDRFKYGYPEPTDTGGGAGT